MISFPTFVELKVENYRLFPGSPRGTGIQFGFDEGSTLIAGINGLGKTTIVNMLYRLLIGPFELPKDNSARSFGANARSNVVPWDARRRFFSQRVADRAVGAKATLKFTLAGRNFEVTRELDTCRLSQVTIDYASVPLSASEIEYQSLLVEASGVGNFTDFLTISKYLTFFNEDRRNILWDSQAQRQFFRILFLSATDSREWSRLEREIGRHDSNARNMSSSAFRLQWELNELEKSFFANAGVGDELSIKQKLLTADLERRQEIEDQLNQVDSAIKNVRRTLERSKIFEDEAERELESLRYSALTRLFPQLDDTATYVLTHLFSDGRCLACEADVPEERRRFEHSLETGDCAVCGADRARQQRVQLSDSVSPATEVERRRLDRAKEAIVSARAKRQADAVEEDRLMDVRRRALDELSRIAETIRLLQQETENLRTRLPPTPEDLENRRKAIAGLQAEQRRAEAHRMVAENDYGKLIEGLRGIIKSATVNIATRFSALATEFLEEECSLDFRMVSGRPSQNGDSFEYPALKFEMTAAAFEGRQIRETPEDVSESQREFVDLAFRMALMIVAANDGPATLVMETPEASLDVIFMAKAAELLKAFGRQGRRVIVTSNLTNTALIPALMGGPLAPNEKAEDRWRRVLNLLEVAEPNAALRHFRERYDAFLKAAVEGRNAA